VPHYELDGSVAVVTGGARGIGEAISLRLGREGADVAVLDMDDRALQGVVAQIQSHGRRALALRVDVTQRDEVNDALGEVKAQMGSVDILVNNAGVLRIKPIMDIDDSDWNLHMNVNAKAILMCSQAAAREMIAQGKGGRIIVIVGANGRLPSHMTLGSYVASKHAAMGLVQQMGLELAPHHILVNAVFPGVVDTAMQEDVQRGLAAQTGRSYESVRHDALLALPLGRFQSPDDVANVVAFLASADANNSVGQAFDANGGVSFW
jgi:NAD(P)-dependent dehydrogenase (short-subunit alcohol dehydrogenase family)